MKTKIIILTSAILLVSILSCNKEPIIDEEETVQLDLPLTDCWTEIEEESFLQFSGSNHIFCFLNDTEFTLKLESWTDIISDPNTPTRWTEYIKGAYVLTNESFEISGNYMDAEFLNLVPGHSGGTSLTRTFEVKVISETEMILDNNDMSPTRGIRLVQ